MDKKYNYLCWPDEKDYTRYERALEKLESCINFIYRYTINLYQGLRKRKVKVHIDDYDVWSVDYTLSLIILPLLKKLKEHKRGAPFVDDEDVPEELRSSAAPPKENEWDTDDNHFKRWDWVLDEMIYSFECCADEDWDEQFCSGVSDYSWEKTEDGKMYQIKEGPNHTFKVDSEAMDKALDRRKNGLRLFGKYYHSLWD
jgi:hypothetical protein